MNRNMYGYLIVGFLFVIIAVVALIWFLDYIGQELEAGIQQDIAQEPELSDKELLDKLSDDTQPMTVAEQEVEINLLDQLVQQNQEISQSDTATASPPTSTTASVDITEEIDSQNGARNRSDLDQLQLLEQMSQ